MKLLQPGSRWEDALPIGNGTIGALVYGGICYETIVLNHEDLWRRTTKPPVPDISRELPELRAMLRAGRYRDAECFLAERLNENGYEARRPDTYHPAFDVLIEMETNGGFRDYERSVDFETGEATVRWRDDDGTWERQTFVSRADDALFISITGTACVSAAIELAPHDPDDADGVEFATGGSDGWIDLVATYPDDAAYPNGNQFGGVARVFAEGDRATFETENGRTRIAGADEILVVVKLFANEWAEAAVTRLRSALETYPPDYRATLARSAELHGELFRRCTVRVAPDAGTLHADRLLLDAYGGDVPGELVQLMGDYGRYLLICSSNSTGWPANLQGVWNGSWHPPWQSDYHGDENIQMNYWLALPGNLPEIALPMFNYYESFVEDYRENARKIYGCRGIVMPIAQTTHGAPYADGGGKAFVNWTGGAGWIAQHFFDYWRFTGDDQFLRQRAVPFMREVALFYEDFLVDGLDGALTVIPSLSPENVPGVDGASLVQMDATMDVAIAREVLTNLCTAYETLGIEDPGPDTWRDMIARLPEYEVNDDGALREWLHPDLPDNYHHRHLSHLYPFFPGTEVTEEADPELCAAAKVAVEKRFDIGLASQSGWSYAHMANIFARMGDGDRALECIETLARACTGPNLFTYHNDWRDQGLTVRWFGASPPFQIDANLGIPAAIYETLVSSTPGVVRLLHGLPSKWSQGAADGLLCRDGVCIGLRWDMDERRIEATLDSRSDIAMTVRLPGDVARLQCSPCDADAGSSHYGPSYREIRIPAGKQVTLEVELVRATGT